MLALFDVSKPSAPLEHDADMAISEDQRGPRRRAVGSVDVRIAALWTRREERGSLETARLYRPPRSGVQKGVLQKKDF